MMSFDYANAKLMVKGLSVLIQGATDDELQQVLEKQALPWIRMTIMNSTDFNGNHIFYDVLGNIADATTGAAAESLIDLLLEEPTLKDGLRRIAALYAASLLVMPKGATFIPGESTGASRFAKEAEKSLLALTNGPLIKSAISSASKKLTTVGGGNTATLYLAKDVDPTTKDLSAHTVTVFAGAQLPYGGAPEAGILGAIINGTVVEVSIAAGDTPVQAFNKLLVAFDGLSPVTKPNIALAIGEKTSWTGSRNITYNAPITNAVTTAAFTTTSSGAYITLLPQRYDPTFDMLVATLYLKSRDPAAHSNYIPGIPGFIYGVDTTLNTLSPYGPYSIAADLTQGKVTNLSSVAVAGTTTAVADSFFFDCTTDSDLTEVSGSLVYQVNAETARTISIPIGTSAVGLAGLFARDLAATAGTQRVLGAIRPINSVTVASTVIIGPSISMVAFGIEQDISELVITLQSVPGGIIFGVVSADLTTSSAFDTRAKSIVISTTVNKFKVSTLQNSSSIPGVGSALKVAYVPSVALAKVLKGFGDFNNRR